MSSIGGPCPKCGDIGPLKVDKTDVLRDWAVFCLICGHHQGPGSYWQFEDGGYEGHCKRMGWEP